MSATKLTPELLILDVSQVILVRVVEGFFNAALVSLFVLSITDETVDERKDNADGGCDNLMSASAMQLVGLKESDRSYRHDPASSVQRLLFLEENQWSDEVACACQPSGQ